MADYQCTHRGCGKLLAVSEPVDHGEAVNIDYTCPEHGPQFTSSWTKAAYLKRHPAQGLKKQGELFTVGSA